MPDSTAEIQQSLRAILARSARQSPTPQPSSKHKPTPVPDGNRHSSPIPVTVPSSSISSPHPHSLTPVFHFPSVNVPGSSLKSATEAMAPHKYGVYPKNSARVSTNSSTLTAARETSRFKSNLWDPEDEEWADMDAERVVETFRECYKPPSPVEMTGALASFSGAMKSVLGTLTRKEEEKKGVQDHVGELGNTYNCAPEGDLNDEIMKNFFLDHVRYFPLQQAITPRNMHVIDLCAYFRTEDSLFQQACPRLCDAVATVLSHTCRECLVAFLNPSIKEFVYRREVDSSKGGLILVVRREGNEVICGAYVNFGFMLQWKLYVKSVVNITGQWQEVFATTRLGMMRINNGTPEWGVIHADMPGDQGEEANSTSTIGSPRKLELSPTKKVDVTHGVNETDPKFMLYQSRILARQLLWDIWYRFDKMYECRASWLADGEESQVRMKRELVGFEDDE